MIHRIHRPFPCVLWWGPWPALHHGWSWSLLIASVSNLSTCFGHGLEFLCRWRSFAGSCNKCMRDTLTSFQQFCNPSYLCMSYHWFQPKFSVKIQRNNVDECKQLSSLYSWSTSITDEDMRNGDGRASELQERDSLHNHLNTGLGNKAFTLRRFGFRLLLLQCSKHHLSTTTCKRNA